MQVCRTTRPQGHDSLAARLRTRSAEAGKHDYYRAGIFLPVPAAKTAGAGLSGPRFFLSDHGRGANSPAVRADACAVSLRLRPGDRERRSRTTGHRKSETAGTPGVVSRPHGQFIPFSRKGEAARKARSRVIKKPIEAVVPACVANRTFCGFELPQASRSDARPRRHHHSPDHVRQRLPGLAHVIGSLILSPARTRQDDRRGDCEKPTVGFPVFVESKPREDRWTKNVPSEDIR